MSKTPTTMTAQQVSEKLGVNPKYIRRTKGQFRFHKSYYWGVTASPQPLIDQIKNAIPTAVITDSGNHYHAFVGGAKSGSSQDSFLWVTFTV